jgi:hypothetical protein
MPDFRRAGKGNDARPKRMKKDDASGERAPVRSIAAQSRQHEIKRNPLSSIEYPLRVEVADLWGLALRAQHGRCIETVLVVAVVIDHRYDNGNDLGRSRNLCTAPLVSN